MNPLEMPEGVKFQIKCYQNIISITGNKEVEYGIIITENINNYVGGMASIAVYEDGKQMVTKIFELRDIPIEVVYSTALELIINLTESLKIKYNEVELL